MKDLFLIIDTSGSMKQDVGDGTRLSHLDCMKAAALDVLDNWSGNGTVEVLSCAGEQIRLIGEDSRAASAIRGLTGADTSGATRRWDAMMEYFEGKVSDCNTEKCQPCTVILFTDNDDDKSERYNLADLRELFDGTPHASFHIMTYSQAASGVVAEPPVPTTEPAATKEDPGLVERDRVIVQSMYVPAAPVLAALACDRDLLDTVGECMPAILRHLQGRSGLDYSPVLTILIDRQSMLSLNAAAVSQPPDDQLRFDVQEMLRLLHGTALNFHMRTTEEFKQQHSECLWNFAQYVAWRLIEYLDEPQKVDRNWWTDSDYRSAKEARPRVFGNDFGIFNVVLVTMEAAGEWLRLVTKGDPSQWPKVAGDFFEDYGRCTIGGKKRREFDLSCWKRRLPQQQWEEFKSEFGDDGRLIKAMDSLRIVHEITLEAVKRLLPLVKRATDARLISECRLYGFYMPPKPTHSSDVERILAGCGLPAHFAFSSSGFVFVCIEDCATLAKQLAKERGQEYSTTLRNILTTVLTHEHGHAIIHQGFDSTEHLPGSQQAIIHGGPAEEALAEWFELDAFRGDLIMTESIRAHADSGSFPSWPYAGALIIECFDSSMDLGGQAFLRLLKLYRRGESDRVAAIISRWHGQGFTTRQAAGDATHGEALPTDKNADDVPETCYCNEGHRIPQQDDGGDGYSKIPDSYIINDMLSNGVHIEVLDGSDPIRR
jgi:hypothetical protein